MISPDFVRRLFTKAAGPAFKLTLWDGKTVSFGKGKPAFHLTVKDAGVFRDILKTPLLGFGEAYMAGRVEIDNLKALLAWALQNRERYSDVLGNKRGRLFRALSLPRSIRKQKQDIAHHYDLGNDFYQLWLDEQMVYSCAYFKTPNDSLDRAQQQKIDHTLAKLRLKKGERLLDVGSGWGALLVRAAKRYGVKATGMTLSKQQLQWTRERIQQEKLDKLVNVEYMDYRELPRSWHGLFDKWVSVGMFEHVGHANNQVFIEQVRKILKPNGKGLLHSITTSSQAGITDGFMSKYIFPGGELPTLDQMIRVLDENKFLVTDIENLWHHYALTLDWWAKQFEQNVETVRQMYDERFVRMWRLYLLGSAAGFRHGHLGLAQIVFSANRDLTWPLTRVS